MAGAFPVRLVGQIINLETSIYLLLLPCSFLDLDRKFVAFSNVQHSFFQIGFFAFDLGNMSVVSQDNVDMSVLLGQFGLMQ